MIYLRQSTASQEITLGKFVDSTDGNTPETALTIANTDILIRKSGATTLTAKNSGGATHISAGVFYAVLDATDTDTIGCGEIYCHPTGALYVKLEFCVLASAVYDVLFGTVAPSTLAAGALMGLADGAVTAAKIASEAITVDKIADEAITAAKAPNLNAAITSRLAAVDYTAPDNATIAAIKAKTDTIPENPAATGAAMTLTTAERAALIAALFVTIAEGTETFIEMLRITRAGVAGSSVGATVPASGDPINILSRDGSKARITGVVDAAGNRTVSATDGS